jgi:mRNA interferase MazF
MIAYRPGDIVVVSFPFSDAPTSKTRPALVISNSLVNKTGDYILVQITSRDKQDGLSISMQPEDFLEKPLPLASFIRTHKVFTIHESLINYRYTRVKASFREIVKKKIIRNIT